jgi:hypothetical protein
MASASGELVLVKLLEPRDTTFCRGPAENELLSPFWKTSGSSVLIQTCALESESVTEHNVLLHFGLLPPQLCITVRKAFSHEPVADTRFSLAPF